MWLSTLRLICISQQREAGCLYSRSPAGGRAAASGGGGEERAEIRATLSTGSCSSGWRDPYMETERDYSLLLNTDLCVLQDRCKRGREERGGMEEEVKVRHPVSPCAGLGLSGPPKSRGAAPGLQPALWGSPICGYEYMEVMRGQGLGKCK